MKTIIVYKKTGGLTCADGDVMEVARGILSITRHTRITRHKVNVSTGLVIDAIRVMLATGEITVDEVEFQFEGKVLEHDQNGRITNWPEGFNDTVTKLLIQIM